MESIAELAGNLDGGFDFDVDDGFEGLDDTADDDESDPPILRFPPPEG